jgi:hypothetical protein
MRPVEREKIVESVIAAAEAAPKPEPIPKRSPLDFEVEDADLRMRASLTQGCALSWARRLVDARFARGDYSMIQALTADMREGMARALVNDLRANK